MKEVSSVIIPAEPGYLTAIRLFASAIAAKEGFDVDTAEDIKLCTAEACMLLINQPYTIHTLKADFSLDNRKMNIDIAAQGSFAAADHPVSEETGLGREILEALTDQLNVGSENGAIKNVSFSKTLSER